MKADSGERKRRPAPRAIRWVGIGLLCVLGLAALPVALIQIPAVRAVLLDYALPRVTERLPGRLVVEKASWPGTGDFEFAGVRWEAGGGKVASTDTLAISLHLWPLIWGDIKAEYLLAHGLWVDVPAMRALFEADSTAALQVKERGFPRPGVVPGLPSVSIDSLSIRASSIAMGGGGDVSGLEMTGGFDFSSGGTGRVHVAGLRARGPEGQWEIGDLALSADLREGVLSGSGSGTVADGYPVVFAVESAGPDEFKVTLAGETGHLPPDEPGLLAKVRFEREGGREGGKVTGIGFDVTLRTPPAGPLAVPALARYLDRLPSTTGIYLTASGAVALRPTLEITAHMAIREPDRLKRGMLALRYTDEVITVDSLALELPQAVTIFTAGGRTGTVAYRRSTGEILIDRLTLAGDLGDITLDGSIDRGGSGEVRAVGVWTQPPAALYRLLGDRPGLPGALRAAWAADAPYSISARATISSAGGERRIRADASMLLPGPRAFAPLLPESAGVADLGPVKGSMRLDLTLGAEPARFGIDLDLSETGWMDTSTVHVSGRGDDITLESCLVSAPPFRLALEGAYDMEAGTGRAAGLVSDAGFLRRFSATAPDFNLKIESAYARAADTSLPGEVSATLAGNLGGASYNIPSVAGTLTRNAGCIRARVNLPEGLVSSYVRLDSLGASFVSSGASGAFPATVTLLATGEKYRLRQRVELDLGDTLSCLVDTLTLDAYGYDIESTRPFRVAVSRKTRAFRIDDMNLAGSLGSVSASGYAGPDDVSLRCNIALDFPESPPPGVTIPAGAWPRRLDAELDAPGPNRVRLEATVQGFVLDNGGAAELNFNLAADESSVTSGMRLDEEGTRRLEGTLFLPAAVSVYPPALAYRDGDVSVLVTLEDYPVLVRERGGKFKTSDDLLARVNGEVNVSGHFDKPAAYLSADIAFPDWPDLADFRIEVEGAVRPDSLRDSDQASRAAELSGRVARALGLERTEKLVAQLTLRRAERTLLVGEISYPVAFAFNPFRLNAAEGRLDAALRSEGLPLEDIDGFLPEDVGLDGRCRINLAGSGPPDDPAISGTVEVADLAVKYRQILSMLVDGNIELQGSARKPALTGNIAIKSGVVNLPGAPKNLHPVEGPSILLSSAWRAAIDTAGAQAGEAGAHDRAAEVKRPFEADIDITLDIAQGFRLRGEGLEVELDGNLQVTQQRGRPVIVGDLNARRGTFLFLGRIFDLTSGTISFSGEEELNPSLNLTLTSVIEKYVVSIKLGGTLKKPELKLTSDPDMSEGDIVAMILFGKPIDSLNEGQGAMLKDRTADILIIMGAARLQQSLAGQGGIDVLSVRSARGAGDQGSALVVGKYITPSLLVSYEQALKEKSTSYIVMEYMLTRYVKLETLYGNQSRTGVGVGVEKDY